MCGWPVFSSFKSDRYRAVSIPCEHKCILFSSFFFSSLKVEPCRIADCTWLPSCSLFYVSPAGIRLPKWPERGDNPHKTLEWPAVLELGYPVSEMSNRWLRTRLKWVGGGTLRDTACLHWYQRSVSSNMVLERYPSSVWLARKIRLRIV